MIYEHGLNLWINLSEKRKGSKIGELKANIFSEKCGFGWVKTTGNSRSSTQLSRRTNYNYYDDLTELINEGQGLQARAKVKADDPALITWHRRVANIVKEVFSIDSDEYKSVKERKFYSSVPMFSCGRDRVSVEKDQIDICKRDISRTVAELEAYRKICAKKNNDCVMSTSDKKVFIVHGHDGELKQAVARMVEKQGLEAIILSEQADKGATIIEKIEKYSDVSAAICLFTPDDFGRAAKEPELKKRARQNVVLETGYFIGKLSRQKVVLVADNGLELPSDLQGIIYKGTQEWEFKVLKELKAMGLNIDLNKQ